MQDRSDITRGILGLATFFFLFCIGAFFALVSFLFFVGAPHAFPPTPWMGSILALLAALLFWIAFWALWRTVRLLKSASRKTM